MVTEKILQPCYHTVITLHYVTYEANSQLAKHTQPQVQEPSAYWSLQFNPKKKKKKGHMKIVVRSHF